MEAQLYASGLGIPRHCAFDDDRPRSPGPLLPWALLPVPPPPAAGHPAPPPPLTKPTLLRPMARGSIAGALTAALPCRWSPRARATAAGPAPGARALAWCARAQGRAGAGACASRPRRNLRPPGVPARDVFGDGVAPNLTPLLASHPNTTTRPNLPSRLRHLRCLLAAPPLATLAAAHSPDPPAFRPPHPTRILLPWVHLPNAPVRRLFSEHAILPTHLQDERFATLSDRIYDAVIKTGAESNEGTEAALDALRAELTTPLVADVLHRLRYEEKLAFRFFAWASHQDGYSHEPATYNDIIDILSGTRYKSRQFGVLCNMLDHMKHHGTRSVPVEDLLEILRAYGEKHLTHMRKLAKKKRWVRMRMPLETDALNVLLDSFCKCGMVKEAEAVFGRVKRRLLGNAETFSILFFGWCRARDPKKAMKVLEEMIQMKHTPESFTYIAAIESFCSAGLVLEARELFEFMRTEGSTISSPTAKTYSIMIVALAKADRMEECFELLSDMRSCGCMPDVTTYKDLIQGMCLVGKLDAAYRVLEEMGRAGFPPDIVTYNCFLNVLCSLRKADDALELCERMIEAHCEPSVHTYNMLMVMFFEMGEAHRALDIWLEMDTRGCQRAIDTYEIMIDGLFDCGRTEHATALLDEVINRDMKLSYKKFDAIMLRLSAVGDLGAIHRLSEHMRRFYNVAMSRRFAITQKKKSIGLRRK